VKPLKDLIAKASQLVREDAPLTPLEHQVIGMMAEGNTDKVIARKVGVSAGAVGQRIYLAKKKVGAKNRAQLVKLWLEKK
jgi:DNA-binding CsgD family transcriptional regulator